jgi:DhnA family fructose-bisphosphate aldolase class Ia
MTGKNDLMDIFLKDGKSLIIAYDQGLEHGPTSDFDNRNVDPAFIVEIACRRVSPRSTTTGRFL